MTDKGGSGRSRHAVAVLVLSGLALSCGYRIEPSISPQDALLEINGEPALPGKEIRLKSRGFSYRLTREGYESQEGTGHRTKWFAPEPLELSLTPLSFDVGFRFLPAGAKGLAYSIDGGPQSAEPLTARLDYGLHQLRVSARDYPEKTIPFEVAGPGEYRFRLDAMPTAALLPLGVYPCGGAPKQVVFSPDSREIYIPLLTGKGFDVIDWRLRTLRRVELEGYGKKTGFVEGVFPPGTDSFIVSQMTTASIHEFSLDERRSPTYSRTISARGDWTKVIAYEPTTRRLALSNWVSSDVTILAYGDGSLIKRLGGLATPRGLAFSPDGGLLYVASFGNGLLRSFDTDTWEETARLSRKGGALRHIVLSPSGSRLYVSDMSRAEVLEVEAADLSVVHVYPTGENPNTIDLSPDGRILAVSCRGPNNPEGYTKTSPARGEVLLFDTAARALLARLPGGLQPTGLDISPDGRLLAFSNFQDNDIEVYDLSRLPETLHK